ncbi:TPR end-of-group domain-containing protein [Hyphomicrobium sp. 2TAF46]|uniref:tetratricopeptide repeat protein n=1 Tax=Hyphomicrobium sp. 2TAF46 TaxID=3233019 RepID=UPI003F936CC2
MRAKQDGGVAEERKRRLESWKEIAAFFNRDERTVRRWERQRGLPIHRVPGGERNLVYAYQLELERWLEGKPLNAEEGEADKPQPALVVAESPAQQPGLDTVLPGSALLKFGRLPIMGVIILSLMVIGLAAFGAFERPSSLPSWPAGLWRSSKTPYAPSPQVRDLYLAGVYNLGTRQTNGLTRAIQYFTEATIRDPNYAAAYVKLADAYNTISQYTLMPAEEAYPRAKAAAERAIALDPNLADGYAALAFTEFYWSRNFSHSQQLFERAIALDPLSAQARHWYALTLMQGGRFEIPLREIAKAQELQPESRAILANKALILFHAGRPAEAIIILRQLADAEPNLRSPPEYLATIYLSEQRYQDFLREYRTAAVLAKNAARIAIADAAEDGFRQNGARGLLESMLVEQKRQYALGHEPAYKLAGTAALLNDTQAALQYLEDAIQQDEPDVLGILIDPAFRSLHGAERYRHCIKRVGLTPLE